VSPTQICNTYDAWILVRRWAAMWLDVLVIAGGVAGIYAATDANVTRTALLSLPWMALYFPLLEGFTGRTPGKLLSGLVVVNNEGNRPGCWRASLRALLRLAEINPLLMGAIPAIFATLTSARRQRFGDMLAKTYVLKTEDLRFLKEPPMKAPAMVDDFALPAGGTGPAEITASVSPFSSAAFRGRRPSLPSRNVIWPLAPAVVTTSVSIGLVALGIHAGQAARKTKPTTITYGKFTANLPQQGWYQIDGCEFDLTDAVYERSATGSTTYSESPDNLGQEPSEQALSPIESIVIPAFGTGDEDPGETPILLRTNDHQLVKLMEEMAALDAGDQAKTEAWYEANADDLAVRRSIKGTVKSPESLSGDVRTALADAEAELLASGYVVVDEMDDPTALAGLFEILAAVTVGVLAALLWLVAVLVPATASPRPSSGVATRLA